VQHPFLKNAASYYANMYLSSPIVFPTSPVSTELQTHINQCTEGKRSSGATGTHDGGAMPVLQDDLRIPSSCSEVADNFAVNTCGESCPATILRSLLTPSILGLSLPALVTKICEFTEETNKSMNDII
jgi:hypothetical protein